MAAERGQPKSVRALATWVLTRTPHTARARCRCIEAATLGHVETAKVLVEVGADTEALMTVAGMDTKITGLQLAVCQGSWTRYAC